MQQMVVAFLRKEDREWGGGPTLAAVERTSLRVMFMSKLHRAARNPQFKRWPKRSAHVGIQELLQQHAGTRHVAVAVAVAADARRTWRRWAALPLVVQMLPHSQRRWEGNLSHKHGRWAEKASSPDNEDKRDLLETSQERGGEEWKVGAGKAQRWAWYSKAIAWCSAQSI
jgi:hypothetical protein